MIVYHPSIEARVAAWLDELPHTSLLTGPKGGGLRTMALHLAKSSDVRVVIPEPLTKTSTVPQIGVERIRELYEDTRTKSTVPTVIIIDDADMMTHSAQNSFLKLLEEPNVSTKFILTSHHPERLLPTVRSRAQVLNVPALNPEQSETLIDTLGKMPATKKAQIRFVAEGLPAEIMRLTEDETYFRDMVQKTTLAKRLIEAKKQEVLTLVMTAPSERSEALALVERAVHLLSLRPTTSTVKRIAKLIDAYERIRLGGNVRLQLAEAVL